MDESKRIILGFASQTGQSKAIAEEMSFLGTTHQINIETKCLSELFNDKQFSIEKEKIMLFVVSTTGDGDPPDTGTRFWRALKKNKSSLQTLKYALLGLGDTNYTHFCNFGKNLNRKLMEMKATPFHPPTWADDAVGIEETVEEWMDGVFKKLFSFVFEEKNKIVNFPNSINLKKILKNKQSNKKKEEEERSGGEENGGSRGIGGGVGKENMNKKKENEKEKEDKNKNEENKIINNEINKDLTSDYEIIVENQLKKINFLPDNGKTSSVIEDFPVKINDGTNKVIINNYYNNKSEKETESLLLEDNLHFNFSSFSVPLSSSFALSLPCPLLPSLQIHLSPNLNPPKNPYSAFPPFYNFEVIDSPYCSFLPNKNSELLLGNVVSSSVLCPGGEGTKQIATIHFHNPTIPNLAEKLKAGDTIAILCPNHIPEVEEFLELLCIPRQDWFSQVRFQVEDEIIFKKKKLILPEKITLFDVFYWLLDLRGILKKTFLLSLSQFSKNKKEKNFLEVLSSREGSDFYSQLCLNKRLNVVDLMRFLPNCKPPLAFLFENLPRNLPRPYSICNSPSLENGKISIVFSVSIYQHIHFEAGFFQPEKKTETKNGLCTGWLIQFCEKKKFEKICFYLRNRSNFHYPSLSSTSLLMIAMGTGIAPFLGFLQERSLIKEDNSEAWLVFGCRNKQDFIFMDSLKNYLKNKVLNKLVVCFSQMMKSEEEMEEVKRSFGMQSDSSLVLGRGHVQEGLLSIKDDVTRFIGKDQTNIYLCGDLQNNKQKIDETLKQCFENQDQGKQTIERLRKEKRIVEDVWL